MLLGLTGGITTGKSTVTRYLAKRAGLFVFDADACVHELLASDEEVGSAVRNEFALGDEPIDRRALGQLIFRDPDARRRLEAILHPVVRDRWRGLAAKSRAERSDFLADIPLLFETGADGYFDAIIVVAASPETQRQRMADRGIPPDLIEPMLASQWPIGQKVGQADYVIWNDGSQAELERQCALLLDAIFPKRHE